jgi:hypothetical protein
VSRLMSMVIASFLDELPSHFHLIVPLILLIKLCHQELDLRTTRDGLSHVFSVQVVYGSGSSGERGDKSSSLFDDQAFFVDVFFMYPLLGEFLAFECHRHWGRSMSRLRQARIIVRCTCSRASLRKLAVEKGFLARAASCYSVLSVGALNFAAFASLLFLSSSSLS